jgi:hypothetical protein
MLAIFGIVFYFDYCSNNIQKLNIYEMLFIAKSCLPFVEVPSIPRKQEGYLFIKGILQMKIL